MERDMKDVIGVLMPILDGAEVSHEELNDLAFEADGELETALKRNSSPKRAPKKLLKPLRGACSAPLPSRARVGVRGSIGGQQRARREPLARAEARALLLDPRDLVVTIAQALADRHTLTGRQIEQMATAMALRTTSSRTLLRVPGFASPPSRLDLRPPHWQHSRGL
jgi:hypothetical protein